MAQLPTPEHGHGGEHEQRERREDNRAQYLRVAGEVFEKLVEKEEIPLGACGRKLLSRIGGGAERGALLTHHKEEHHHQHSETGNGVTQHLFGPEPLIGALQRLLRGEPVLAKEIHVSHDEQHDQAWQHTRMQRKEARQREMPVGNATNHHRLQRLPHTGAHANQIGGNRRGPVPVLVPWQQIARKRQRQHEHEQPHAEPVVHLAWRFVGPVDDDLHEVQHQQHRHGLRHEMVQAAQEPAAQHLVLDVVHALPRGLRTGAVGHPQRDTRDELHYEEKGERAAPDVAPACATGHVFKERLVQQPLVTGSRVDPRTDGRAFVTRLLGHQTAILSGEPLRKFWKRTQTSPSRTTASSSSMPRGLGLLGSAIAPSSAKLLR